MKARTTFLVAAALVVTGSEWVLWSALRDATHGLQHMARVYAAHRCPDVTVTAELRPASLRQQRVDWHYVAGAPLVQPGPMQDPAIARNPITLGNQG